MALLFEFLGKTSLFAKNERFDIWHFHGSVDCHFYGMSSVTFHWSVARGVRGFNRTPYWINHGIASYN